MGLHRIFLTFWNAALVCAPHVGYFVQYLHIEKTGNIAGYSAVVSVILLVSYTMRFYYYFGSHYAMALFLQAILGTVMQVALIVKVLEIHAAQEQERVGPGFCDDGAQTGSLSFPAPCRGGVLDEAAMQPARCINATDVEVENGGVTVAVGAAPSGDQYARSADDLLVYRAMDVIEDSLMAHDPRSFLVTYLLCCTAGFAASILLSWFISWMPSVLGCAALGVEAILVVPQILRNARRRSCEGLTETLVGTWVCGDAIKIVYFVLAKQPLPFLVCGCVQLALDFVVIGQMIYYRVVAGMPTSSVTNMSVVAQRADTTTHAGVAQVSHESTVVAPNKKQ